MGPLEYLVISVPDHRAMDEVLPALTALHEQGGIHVVDLLLVSKDDRGTVSRREVGELSVEEQDRYASLDNERWGLLTAEDIDALVAEMPAGASAVILLLEHTWALGLTEAVRRAGGGFITGGLVSPSALEQMEAELAAAMTEP